MDATFEFNLDRLAAIHGQAIVNRTTGDPINANAKDVDNTVTKALGVLQENGVYACFLYLKSRKSDEKRRADVIASEILNLLNDLGFSQPQNSDALAFIAEEICSDLERILLVKDTLEQMLIYARYGAKAHGN